MHEDPWVSGRDSPNEQFCVLRKVHYYIRRRPPQKPKQTAGSGRGHNLALASQWSAPASLKWAAGSAPPNLKHGLQGRAHTLSHAHTHHRFPPRLLPAWIGARSLRLGVS